MDTLYKILKVLILVLLIAVIVAGGWLLKGRDSVPAAETTAAAENAANSAAVAAPDITVYDLEGNSHKISDFQGKPVILNFWASWCGPCKSEMPDIEEAYQEYGEQIHFLIVDLTDGTSETVETASGYIAEQGYTFPVYYDTGMEGSAAYSITGIPTTYFIDENGYIVVYYQGAMSADTLQKGIDILLNGE